VTVSLDFSPVPIKTTANSTTGNWSVLLPPQVGSLTPHTIVIEGDNSTIKLTDVLYGDVWLCSGQSNMEFNVKSDYDGASLVDDSINYPYLRLFIHQRIKSQTPSQESVTRFPDNTSWAVSSPFYVGGPGTFSFYSAVCYLFGRNVYQSLNGSLPIGLIQTSWSATSVETWSSPEAIDQCGPVESQPQHLHEKAVKMGPVLPSLLYNGMISPLLPTRLAGILWYQGEENSHNATSYACRFPALIRDWRDKFMQKDLPFYFVLLAAWSDPTWPSIRAAQLEALNLPFVSVASAQDLGDPDSPFGSIHSRNKTILGDRLARLARQNVYGQSVVSIGPTVADVIWPPSPFSNDSVILRLDPFLPNNQGIHLSDTAGCTNCCNLDGSPIQLLTSDNQLSRAVVKVRPEAYVIEASLASKSEVIAVFQNWEGYPNCSIYSDVQLPMLPFAIYREDWMAMPRHQLIPQNED